MRGVGMGLVVVGAVMVVAGTAGMLAGRGGGPPAAAPPPSTTTTAPPTTTSSSSTSSSTTTTTTTTTTSPPPPAETLEEFVAAFAAATERDDVEFLLERLHPVVIDVYGEDACRAFVEGEIVQLSDYRLSGTVERSSRSFDTPSGPVTVDPVYVADISFVFQGQRFEVTGLYAPLDGQMRWFGECRE